MQRLHTIEPMSINHHYHIFLYSDYFLYCYLPVADRLHTMRTLRSLPLDDSERLKIAEESLKVYAPLAHRMGVMKVKGELEDLAFKHLHPDVFQVQQDHFIDNSILPISALFSPKNYHSK